MMLRASLRASVVGFPLGVSRMLVPPWRSRPSSGFQVPARATSPKAIASPRKNTPRVRPGRAVLRAISVLLGDFVVGRFVRLWFLFGVRLVEHLADRAARDPDGHAV